VVPLLTRLEHEQHAPGDLAGASRQQARRAHQHRGVRVVAARVHRVAHLRRELEARVLGHRQRVHVAAEQHRRPRLATRQHGGDAAGGLVQRDVQRQSLDRLEHDVARDRQVVPHLGPLVQRAPQLRHVVEQVAGFLAQCVGRHG
jgi:hypothetical protein